MSIGLNEAALLISIFLAGYSVRPTANFAFRFFGHWLAGLVAWIFLICLVFLPAILISAFTSCNYRGEIGAIGFLSGAAISTFLEMRKRRSNSAL